MTENYSTKFFFLAVVALASFEVILFLVSIVQEAPLDYLQNLPVQTLTINNDTLDVFIVDTPIAQARGLSFVPGLPSGTGMMFVFVESHIPKFWMKDMRFDLDMIWLDESLAVIDIHQNITPDTYPEIFSPISPASYVIEVTAGVVNTLDIGVGDVVTILQDL